MTPLNGIHHVTAITGDAQRNLDFYTGVLGVRLVKKTVNFDDPGSYHLYYGDKVGSPGTLLTFFVWPGAAPAVVGSGEPVAIALGVGPGALPYWKQRLSDFRITASEKEGKLLLSDHDAIRLELVEAPRPEHVRVWTGTDVEDRNAIHSVNRISLSSRRPERSRALFEAQLFGERGSAFVAIEEPVAGAQSRMGAGTIHHVAFRTNDDASQAGWLQNLTSLSIGVSPVMDRKYFHSIYFREPGGVLFEIATDGPGFAVDQQEEHLGESLALPREYEPMRARLEATLTPLRVQAVPARS